MTLEAFNDDLGAEAKKFVGLGWHIFPCMPGRKEPLTPRGFKDAVSDVAKVEKWWSMRPKANIGIACGASQLGVLDVDTKNGGRESFQELLKQVGEEAFNTVRARTGGGGVHFFYRTSTFKVATSAGKIAKGIDTRGDGGYVVAPPSIHESGNRYHWVDGCSPWEKPLLAFPPVLLERLNAARMESVSLPSTIQNGGRNATLASLGGMLRRRGLMEQEILPALAAVNQVRCQPPLEEAEVRSVTRSICRYPPGMAPINGLDVVRMRYMVAALDMAAKDAFTLCYELGEDPLMLPPEHLEEVSKTARELADMLRNVKGEL